MPELNSLKSGLVLWALGHQARILIDDEEFLIDIPGKWRLTKQDGKRPLAPGDFVALSEEDRGWKIKDQLPRRNEFTRNTPGYQKPIPQVIAANLDLAVLIASPAEPATPFGFIDRLLVTAELGEVEPALIINKIDLASESELQLWIDIYKNAVDTILFTSATENTNLDKLDSLIRNKVVLFAGRSGVGKSTLANIIDPSLNIHVGEISEATGKGRHTTTIAEMHKMSNGAWLVDTPGLRECGPYSKTPANLSDAFPEIRNLKENCKFRNCVHRKETGCAVREIVGTDLLPEERYKNYLKMLEEAENELKPGYNRTLR